MTYQIMIVGTFIIQFTYLPNRGVTRKLIIETLFRSTGVGVNNIRI